LFLDSVKLFIWITTRQKPTLFEFLVVDLVYRHTPVKASHHAASRTITATEVRDWFGKSRKSRLGNAQYREIGAFLTKIRWPSDAGGLLGPQPSTVEIEPDIYWDFDAAFDAATLLLDNLPAMLRHWNGLLWAPETRGGHPAIKALQDTLTVALPYIEWPFGEYERQTGRKKPKTWHLPSIMVARVVVKAMIDAGHDDPGITRNSL
jgi:hypothetical protein